MHALLSADIFFYICSKLFCCLVLVWHCFCFVSFCHVHSGEMSVLLLFFFLIVQYPHFPAFDFMSVYLLTLLVQSACGA